MEVPVTGLKVGDITVRPDSERRILIEGLDPEDILALPDEHIAALIAVGPLIFKVGSAEILGQIRLTPDSLLVELAQIDGGGEGVLPTLWRLADRFAQQHRLGSVEWVVHAITCAHPNLKLRRLLVKRGFVIKDVEGIGPAYYFRHAVDTASSNDA